MSRTQRRRAARRGLAAWCHRQELLRRPHLHHKPVAGPGFDLHAAVWNVTDDLRRAGQSAESLVKRVKYIAAIPIAFHYRIGYRSAQLRLRDAVERAISLGIARYFADEGGSSGAVEDY